MHHQQNVGVQYHQSATQPNNNNQSQYQRIPPPPPPPSMSMIPPNNIPPNNNYVSHQNNNKVQFQSNNINMASCDMSYSSCDSSITYTSNIKDLDALSPKLRSYFNGINNNNNNTNNNHTGVVHINNTTGNKKNGNNQNKKDYTNVLFSPETQYLDDDEEDDNETFDTENNNDNEENIHSIFSPNFQAKSAKKKKKKMNRSNFHNFNGTNNNDSEGGGDVFHSIFSPVSTTSTTARGDHTNNNDDINSTAISEMSDEYSTIHAILRGERMENIKKHVGLDEANHPLSSNTGKNGMMMGTNSNVDSRVSTKPTANHEEENSIGDSTAAMLDKARHLTSQGKQMSKKQGLPTFFSPPGRNDHYQSTSSTRNTKTTPKVSPTSTSSDDEFYTPTASSAKKKKKPDSTSSSMPSKSPMSLNFDIGRMSTGNNKGLAPVWEENNTGMEESGETTNDDEEVDNSPMNMGDFRTPKQQQYDGKDMEDCSDEDDDEEEEFFSPLVQHSAHSPKHHDVNNDSHHNFLVGSTLTLDFNVADESNTNYEQLSVTQAEVPLSDVPPAATAVPTKKQSPSSSSSPRFKEMKQGLQSLLKDAKDLSSPDKDLPAQEQPAAATPSISLRYPQAPYNPNVESSFHLHSPSISSLPPDALTVDFVKSCGCIETLQAILSLLSDDNNHMHRNNGKRGKQLRYPSLVRLVEKRLQKMQKDLSKAHEEEEVEEEQAEVVKQAAVQVRPRIAARGKVLRHPGAAVVDKENVDPVQQIDQAAGEIAAREVPKPMDSITVLHDSINEDGEVEGSADQSISPLVNEASLMSKSSLDMNLSESMTLDDESYYWKHGMNDEKEENQVAQHHVVEIAEKNLAVRQSPQQTSPRTTERNNILLSYEEVKEKLASTLVSNARLTEEVDSLVKQQNEVKAELSSKLQRVVEQLSQQRAEAATENVNQQKQITELDSINCTLREEVDHLQKQLDLSNKRTKEVARQLQAELEEARAQHSNLSQDKETLAHELNDIRSRYEKAKREVSRLKLILDKQNATPDKNKERLQEIVKSAKLANQALANALAVSEKDLAEAYEAKDKSARECDELRNRTANLEDKTSFLSSKVKELFKELQSSHVYIDQLYADLQANRIRSPSKEVQAEFQAKEMQWMELERGYSQRIQDLEAMIGSEKNKVSMDAYMSVVKQTRHYKSEFMKVKEQLESLQKSSPTLKPGQIVNGGGKSMRVLQSIGRSKQIVPAANDENKAPSNAMERSKARVEVGGKQQQGKQLNRAAVIRAIGGRKGLQEQLKRARPQKKAA